MTECMYYLVPVAVALVWIPCDVENVAQNCYNRFAHKIVEKNIGLIKCKTDLVSFTDNVQIVIIKSTKLITDKLQAFS